MLPYTLSMKLNKLTLKERSIFLLAYNGGTLHHCYTYSLRP